MRKSLGRIGFALLLLVLVAFIALATWEPFWAKRGDVALPDRTYTAEISRDEFGGMSVALDGKTLVQVGDRSFRDPFSGITMANEGGEFAVREISVMGMH